MPQAVELGARLESSSARALQAHRTQMKELIESVVLLPVRLRTFLKDRRRRPVAEDALRTIRRTHDQAVALGLIDLGRLYNVAMFIVLLDDDLSQLSSDMVRASHEGRRKFVARQMAVLLYEVAEDLPQLLGKDFRRGLVALDVDSDAIVSLNQITKGFARFWTQHSTQLEEIRSLAGAHRDHDAIAQLTLLDTLKPLQIFGLAAEFSASLRELVDWISAVMLSTGGVDAIMRQFVNKGRSRAR
jgi:hypothetical protein